MPLYYYQTDIGQIGISEENGSIDAVYFKYAPRQTPEKEIYETALIKEAAAQLMAYFAGRLREFSLPLAPVGTEFMKQVWRSLTKIPYGSTMTYGQIAKRVGKDKAFRAVGMACNRNPIPIIIPCHRVVGARGNLVGFRGGLEMKQRLLDLERD